MATPKKASKSAPEKTDLVNQQPPKPTQQIDSEPSSQTQTQTQTHNLPLSTTDQPSSC